MYDARVLAHSVSPTGYELVSLAATFPRFILAEANTHRMLCLAGDSQLEFDLPTGQKGGSYRRVHRMRIDEFVDKWIHGARRFAANPKRQADLSWVEPGKDYPAPVVAARLGMASASNVHLACRDGTLPAHRSGRTWMVPGAAVLSWRQSSPEHTRFDIRARLAAMAIRQINEKTGDVQLSRVLNAVESGTKDVFEVVAGSYSVAGSADHHIATTEGWTPLRGLKPGDLILVRKFGKRGEDLLDPMRLKKIDGVWRSQWQRTERERLLAEDDLCRRCRERPGECVHHIEPVYKNPERAFDQTNITLLCSQCHDVMHERQGWQGGKYLYGAAVAVEAVTFRGVEQTYDLEIAGEFPNFLANGVVVHNSRNSASSRAIPVERRIEQVRSSPFVPEAFGKNKRGMQAHEALGEDEDAAARAIWAKAAEDAAIHADALAAIGVHKQHANRLIETFAWHTIIVTATEWSNWDALRVSKNAQPEMHKIAGMMREVRLASIPLAVRYEDWHLPLVRGQLGEGDGYHAEELGLRARGIDPVKVCVGRCAAVSYSREEETTADKASAIYDRLRGAGHLSPFEHACRPMDPGELDLFAQPECVWDGSRFLRTGKIRHFLGNVEGWVQQRKLIPGEDVYTGE